jgi:epimerase transport system membrane fusion protein
MVLGLSVHTIGAVIPPGGKLLDLVPQNEKLLAEAQVSPIDIDRVRIGQTAEIRFTAFKLRDTPKIDGKLIAISADRLIEEKEKTPYYLARVEITPTGLEELARNRLELIPGMPAEVLINTGERTLFQYLVAPVLNTVARSFTED